MISGHVVAFSPPLASSLRPSSCSSSPFLLLGQCFARWSPLSLSGEACNFHYLRIALMKKLPPPPPLSSSVYSSSSVLILLILIISFILVGIAIPPLVAPSAFLLRLLPMPIRRLLRGGSRSRWGRARRMRRRSAPSAVHHPLLGKAPPHDALKRIIGDRRTPCAVQRPLLDKAPPQYEF